MKEWPDSFWAGCFILLACVLAIVTLFAPHPDTAVITMASSIITGAFGYIQGKKAGQDSVQIPVSPSPVASTTAAVANPTQPGGPA